jgi:hypothetical protein
MLARNQGIAGSLLFWGSLLGWFALHLFFISADPGLHLGPGRDAWTDEGLYTAQLRNYLNTGHFNLEENPTFFKTPFFNVILLPFFLLMGNQLYAARLGVLVFTMLALIYVGRRKEDRGFALILLYTAFSQVYIFTYAHLAMAEVPGAIFILLGIQQLGRWPVQDSLMGRIRVIMLAQICFSLAFLTKAMYAYILVFIPLAFMGWSVVMGFRGILRPRQLLSFAAISVMAVLLFIMIYWIVWIIPHNDWAVQIWQYEGTQRFAAWGDIPGTIKFWLLHVYTDRLHGFHLAMFVLALGCFMVFRLRRKLYLHWPGFLWMLWVIIELHKLALTDQPTRYQVGLLMAMGAFTAFMVRQIQISGNRVVKMVAIISVSLFAGKFSGDTRWLLERRSYSLRTAGMYVQQHIAPGDTVMGPWAGSLCWNTSAYVVPVWSGYMNDKDIRQRFHPGMIITEPMEEDSDGAFRQDGWQLKNDTATAAKMQVGNWTLFIYDLQP